MSNKKKAVTNKSEAREDAFKGRPVLALHRYAQDRHPLRFGLIKAGLILEHVGDIRSFIAKHASEAGAA